MTSPKTLKLRHEDISTKSIEALLHRCTIDPKLANDRDIFITINTTQKLGLKKDYIPRIIPLSSSKLQSPRDLRILLITKDPSNVYRDVLTKDEHTKDLLKEVFSYKKLRRICRGNGIKQIYNDFDMVLVDFRVQRRLPDILGAKFFRGSKKIPFVVKLLREKPHGDVVCDPAYVRAQVRSICKNTFYLPNADNCLSVRVGRVGKHSVEEIVTNAQDVTRFLTDPKLKTQGGGIVKGGITSIFIKTDTSISLPLYKGTQ